MQTFQLLTVGVGTAITLGLSSSAVWGSPQAIAPETLSQAQHPSLPSVPTGYATPTAPGTLRSVQFLTATKPAPVTRFTALVTPFLSQPLPVLGTVSPSPDQRWPSQPSAPWLAPPDPRTAIAAGAPDLAVETGAIVAPDDTAEIAPAATSLTELEATTDVAPEHTADVASAKTADTEPENTVDVPLEETANVAPAAASVPEPADALDIEPDNTADVEAEDAAIAPVLPAALNAHAGQLGAEAAEVAALTQAETSSAMVPDEAIGDSAEVPQPQAIADTDAANPAPVPDAATPAYPAHLTTEANPTVTPQTELPAAHELQHTQTDDRAEAVTPRAVSVNEPYPQTEGPISELNPNPDLLYLPDTPAEVQIQLTQPITLRQAVEQAMSNSLTLRDTQLRLDRSRAQLREAQAAWAPVVSLQSVLQRSDSSTVERTNRRRAQNPSPLNNLLGASDTVSRTLTGIVRVDWDIFTGGRRMANIRAAQQQVRISELEVKRQTDIIILDISNSYFDLQEADAQVGIAEAAVNSAQQSLRDAQLQFQAGVGTRFDVLRAEVQLANEKQNLTNRLAQQQVARRRLAQQLNVPQTVNLIASSNVQVAGTWTLPLEETIIQAYANRPGLEQRLAERELRLQQRRAELATVRPQLSTFADYDVLKDLDDGIGLTDGNTLGLRLSWRLYDGGAARARARQRSLEAQIAEVGFSDIRNQIRFEVERAYSNLLSNFENIDTARLAVDQAEEALRLARLRFQAGVGTQTEVINAETDLTNARGNLLQAVINYNRSLATLERAVSLPIADSQTINEGGDRPVRSGSGS